MLYSYLTRRALLLCGLALGAGCIEEPARPQLDRPEALGRGDGQAGVSLEGGRGSSETGASEAGLNAGVMVGGGAQAGHEGGEEQVAGLESGLQAGGGSEPIEPIEPIELPSPSPEEERCDGLDNDLDGAVDEEVSNACGGCEPLGDSGALSCQAWLLQAIHPVEGPVVTPLDPARLFNQAGVVMREERFALPPINTSDEATCTLLSVEAGPIPDLGRVGFESPLATFAMGYQPTSGRYEPVGGGALLEPLIAHRPSDRVTVTWEGFDEQAGWASFEEGSMSVRSPASPQPTTGELVRPVLERFAGRLGSGEPVVLRWRAEGVSAAPQALPAQELNLYVGGSRSVVQRGEYREIHHFQLGLTLADDGEYALPPELGDGHRGSALWVYVERATRDWLDRGRHSISARVGHRVELREQAGPAPEEWQAPLRLTAPAEGLEAISLDEGLFVSWEPIGTPRYEGLTLSLITQGPERLSSLRCELDASARLLRLPAELVSYWPSGEGSLRLLTLRANLKEIGFTGADRGRYTEGVSLLQYLPQRAP